MGPLECVICNKHSDTIKVLPCLHNICEECAKDNLNGVQTRALQIFFSCPGCDFKIPIHDHLVDSLKVLKNTNSDKTNKQGNDGDKSGNVLRKFACVAEQTSHEMTIKIEYKDKTLKEFASNGDDSSSRFVQQQLTECSEEKEFDHENDPSEMDKQKEYITELLTQVTEKISRKEQQLEQMNCLYKSLDEIKTNAIMDLEERAVYLCSLINDRKNKLQQEINATCSNHMEKYKNNQKKIQKQISYFYDAYNFANYVMDKNHQNDLENLHSEISGRLLDLIHAHKSGVDIFNIKLDVPDRGKEELHLSKLFGQVLKGNVNCGQAELISSFDIELSWPSSLITTKLNDYVVVGKTGAFDTSGRVMFCDSHGQLKSSYLYPDETVPFDSVSLQDGSILVSDNRGHLTHFSPQGISLDVWKQKFKGSGRMAVNSCNNIIITSSEDQCVFEYNAKGDLLRTFKGNNSNGQIFHHPHGLAVDGKDRIVIADYQQHCVIWLDSNGNYLQKYSGSESSPLKCPSAVCCDPFNNILVADFTNDSVHLVSSSGQFMGYLLTKDNNLSCPNFLTLSNDGLLFVGQYGGEIHAFRYLSCSRNA